MIFHFQKINLRDIKGFQLDIGKYQIQFTIVNREEVNRILEAYPTPGDYMNKITGNDPPAS